MYETHLGSRSNYATRIPSFSSSSSHPHLPQLTRLPSSYCLQKRVLERMKRKSVVPALCDHPWIWLEVRSELISRKSRQPSEKRNSLRPKLFRFTNLNTAKTSVKNLNSFRFIILSLFKNWGKILRASSVISFSMLSRWNFSKWIRALYGHGFIIC